MKISYGQNAADKSPVIWDSARTINPHCIVLGDSGVGKTYRLIQMIRDIYRSTEGQVRIHILDRHGDIQVQGASSVKFSESTDFGFNPLEVGSDPDFGGVRKRIQAFVAAIGLTSHKLGPRQEAVLRNLLTDLYQANGFKLDDPSTWVVQHEAMPVTEGRLYLDVPFEEKERAKSAGAQWDMEVRAWYVDPEKHAGPLLRWGPKQFGRKHPTVLDALRFAKRRLNAMYFGANSAAMVYLDDAVKRSKALMSKEMQAARRGEDMHGKEKMQEDIDAAKRKFLESMKDFVGSMRTGRELEDYIKYDSADVMKSVVDRLENLNSIGIFRSTLPPFNPRSAIWHYDIMPLRDEEAKLFVTFRLEAIFAHAVQLGKTDKVREVIILDEADLYTNDDPDHILNKLVKEARKFGVALVMASQAPSHFSDTMLSGVAVRLILGLDKFHWPVLIRKLGVDERSLNFVIPKKRCVLQIKNAGEQQSKCVWVNLAEN